MCRSLCLFFALLCGGAFSLWGQTTFSIISDAGDGNVWLENNAGLMSDSTFEDFRVGLNGDFADRQQASTIYFFALPDLFGFTIQSVSLTFPHNNTTNSGLSFNVDVWALGFTSSAMLDTAWHFVGSSDTDLGPGGMFRTLIQDDVLTPSSFDPDSAEVEITTSASANAALLSFVNDAFISEAQPGDFLVIRLNADSIPGFEVGTPGYEIGNAEFTDSGFKPALTIVAIPEPGTVALLLAGVLAVCVARRRVPRPL